MQCGPSLAVSVNNDGIQWQETMWLSIRFGRKEVKPNLTQFTSVMTTSYAEWFEIRICFISTALQFCLYVRN